MWYGRCITGRMRSMMVLALPLLALACGGATSDASASDDADFTQTHVDAGSFSMTERAGAQLSTIFCDHYMQLELKNGAKGAVATFEGGITQACRDGGEELPPSQHVSYPLREVSKDACGGRVLEGTAPWGGAVTRTLRIRDDRKACGSPSARLVVEDRRTYKGETNLVATYYSVDSRR
jgi:hypothetical protein